MIPLDPLGLSTARELIDYRGRSDAARAFAEEQLEGAVALHNILCREGFAYLADEVGMGKTYVALGVVGLLRHYHPSLRVLYVAPRQNIQKKWLKEIRNFASNNWRIADNRVRTLRGTPAKVPVFCDNLLSLARAAALGAERDFIARMSSFSLALPDDAERWRSLREEARRIVPWLDPEGLDLRLRDKERFKEAFARILNVVLPRFDLLVVDEGHNLKHGYGPSVSTRNRLLALALGRRDPDVPLLDGGGPRADRVLVLSATPVEGDFREMWNQMDVLGKGGVAPALKDERLSIDELKEVAGRILLRRLTGLRIGGRLHTKNMYRREWRGGGVASHDLPLRVASSRERLVVALVQKKVLDVLRAIGRLKGRPFSRSFQIGMLSSFESFLQTARSRAGDDGAGVFDQADQTEDLAEREGADTRSLNRLARSFEQRFGEALPHPKMDAVAEELGRLLRAGEKALVFVRRVGSVRELASKVAGIYDRWLLDLLLARTESVPRIQQRIRTSFERYQRDRHGAGRKPQPAAVERAGEEDPLGYAPLEDEGGDDTFFSWFFRGDGPRGILSGAAFRRNRLGSQGSIHSTLLDDNYLLWLLGRDGPLLDGIATAAGFPSAKARDRLRGLAAAILGAKRRFPRRPVYLAYQQAGLALLARSAGALAERAAVILRERFPGALPEESPSLPAEFPPPESFLSLETFFSDLSLRPTLRSELWPEPAGEDFTEAFRERERCRELLAAAISLGHPIVDLWLLAARRLKTLSLRRQETDEGERSLAAEFLDLLESQRGAPGLSSWRELADIGRNFHLLLDVNFPELRDRPLPELPRYFQATLQEQVPVGGMWGEVNGRLVKQFRMPGYPYVLVTTDVLQEGEDLHTFAARVFHYGITWTPSAMEQRTGRLDRIGSLTQRRLHGRESACEEEFLQVYYPYLRDTVEVLQVREVLRRMNRFLELLHEGLGRREEAPSSVEVARAIHAPLEPLPSFREPLRTSFGIREGWLPDVRRPPAVGPEEATRACDHFDRLVSSLSASLEIDWEPAALPGARMATVYLRAGRLVAKGEPREGTRRQPLHFFLRSSSDGAHLLLRVVSPVGRVGRDDLGTIRRILRIPADLGFGKVCAIPDDRADSYDLSAEGDILFSPEATQPGDLLSLLGATGACADAIEAEILRTDARIDRFRADLSREAHDA